MPIGIFEITLFLLAPFIIEIAIFKESIKDFWYLKNIWQFYHLGIYYIIFSWTLIKLFNKNYTKYVFYFTLIVSFTLLRPNIILPILHSLFLEFKIYELLNLNKSSFVNKSFVWIILLSISNLSIGIMFFWNYFRNNFKLPLNYLFPFVANFAVLFFTLFFHYIIVHDGLVVQEKLLCEKTYNNIKNMNFAPTKCDSGVYSCALIDKDLKFDKIIGDDIKIKESLNNAKQVIDNNNLNFFNSINGLNITSTCYIKIKNNEESIILAKIDADEFSVKFEAATLAFHKLTGIASMIWVFGLLYHLGIFEKRRIKKNV